MYHCEHNKDYDQYKVNRCHASYSPQDSGKKEHTMTKAKKTRTKTIKDMTRTKTKPEIHHHPEILQLGTIGHPARGEHGSIIR